MDRKSGRHSDTYTDLTAQKSSIRSYFHIMEYDCKSVTHRLTPTNSDYSLLDSPGPAVIDDRVSV